MYIRAVSSRDWGKSRKLQSCSRVSRLRFELGLCRNLPGVISGVTEWIYIKRGIGSPHPGSSSEFNFQSCRALYMKLKSYRISQRWSAQKINLGIHSSTMGLHPSMMIGFTGNTFSMQWTLNETQTTNMRLQVLKSGRVVRFFSVLALILNMASAVYVEMLL
jgi:hypothetical protein